MLSHAKPYATSHVMPHYAMLCHVMPCHAMPTMIQGLFEGGEIFVPCTWNLSPVATFIAWAKIYSNRHFCNAKIAELAIGETFV